MTRLPVLLLLLLATAAGRSYGELRIGQGTTVAFATVDRAREILAGRDDFVRSMSPFDRAARMKTARAVSEEDYLAFVAKNVLTWNDAEEQKVTAAFQSVRPELEAQALPLPRKIFLVKTTGSEEGNAPYTRANAIVLPEAELRRPGAKIRKTLCHELFHILSRTNPELREKLYAAIGFVKCREVAFPPELKPRKITNPDAPKNDHCIRLQAEGSDRWAVPILFSSAEKYDPTSGGEFFDYLQFRFLLVERSGGSPTAETADDGRPPKLVRASDVRGLAEQIGMNTRYIIHPEEILADNFALLVLGSRDLPSPEVVERLKEISTAKRIGESHVAADARGE